MEQASNKLRVLLDEVKYDAPQSLHADLITHITDDTPYAFFRYVQSLLSHRRLDALLLSNRDLWLHVRSMYWERFPWLIRSDLKTGAVVPEPQERNKRLGEVLGRAVMGEVRGEDKEEWITEFLERNGLSWGDVEGGRHLTLEVPGTGYLRLANEGNIELDSNAGIYGLDEVVDDGASEVEGAGLYESEEAVDAGDSKVKGGDEPYPGSSSFANAPEEGAGSPGEGPSQAPVVLSSDSTSGTDSDSDHSDEEPEFQGPMAKMATSLPSPDNSSENIRTRESPFREARDIDTGEHMDTSENNPPSPSDTSHTQTLPLTPEITPNITPDPSEGPKPSEHGWLQTLLKAAPNVRAADFMMHPYKNWLVAGPAVTLGRISNFLRDEDIDRTPEWERKVAEITEYVAYLLVNHDGEKHRWGYELQEAIQLLRTHAAFEDYHYEGPHLTLHFPEGEKKSERLPAVEGFNIEIKLKGKPLADYSASRNLLHRLPQGVWDAMYNMPRDALYGTFLEKLRNDEKAYWTRVRVDTVRNRRPAMKWRTDRVVSDEYPLGFNMCEAEDDTFISCMEQGPLRTYQELKRTCQFTFKAEDMGVKEKAGRAEEGEEEGEEGANAKRNKQLLQFSRFRGANRAALTFSLRTLGSQAKEIRAVASPWRRVVVPTPEQRKKKTFPGVIWQPAKLSDDEVPKEGVDPMAYNFWHSMLLESQGSWAKAKIPEVEKKRGEEGPPVPRTNFKGPFTAVDVSEERYNDEQFLRQLKKTWRDLETASRLYPRRAIKEVLIYLKWGRQGLPPAREEEGMFPPNTITHDNSKREVLPLKPGDKDLELLERVAHGSVNEMMLKLVPKEWGVRKRVFADRVQDLVADLSLLSIFATTERGVELREVVEAVNVDVGGPVKKIKFTEEEAVRYLADLETFQRVSITKTHTDKEVKTTYSRPKTDIHPEHTIHWPPDSEDPLNRPRQPPTYLSYEYIPKLDPHIKDLNLQRTIPLLKGAAWRLGKTIRALERTLRSQKPLTTEQKAAFRKRYRDLTREWERSVEAQRNAKSQRQAMGNTDVVRYADPSNFNASWAADDAPDDPEAQASVRNGMLRETCENKTMLWPVRWRRVKDKVTGEERVVWERDGVWGWARPDVRKSRRYFDVNRWPLHLQSEKRQAEIKRASGMPMPNAVMGGVKRGVVVGEEERLKGRVGELARELRGAKLGGQTRVSLAGLGVFE